MPCVRELSHRMALVEDTPWVMSCIYGNMDAEMRNRMIRDGVLTVSEAEGSSLQGAAIDARWEKSSDDRLAGDGNRPGIRITHPPVTFRQRDYN